MSTVSLGLAMFMMIIGIYNEHLWFIKLDAHEMYEPHFLAIFWMLVAIYFRIKEVNE